MSTPAAKNKTLKRITYLRYVEFVAEEGNGMTNHCAFSNLHVAGRCDPLRVRVAPIAPLACNTAW